MRAPIAAAIIAATLSVAPTAFAPAALAQVQHPATHPPIIPFPSPFQLQVMSKARKVGTSMPSGWWATIAAKPDAWFKTEEARAIGDNIISWQISETGAWPGGDVVTQPFRGEEGQIGWRGHSSSLYRFDQMRFLARLYAATGEERYRQSLDTGLAYVLEAQTPKGGWPYGSHPSQAAHNARYATFNDDATTKIMEFVREVATEPAYAKVNPGRQVQAKAAFDKGIAYILRAQIVADGKLTAWGAQHDEVTYEPRMGRMFEPPAISANESAGVVLLLMTLENPSPEVVRAVESAVAWYKASALKGVRIDRPANGDRVVVADPKAKPIWARYYEIPTNRPIFAGRDGIVRYTLAPVELERRAGYAWYGDWGDAVIERYQTWAKARA
ncbi:pectate lyase [Caulobacter sp. NIBR2454]|uniref:pectate lyase n=1 Tax=Caulobacter sp. NIBR2454 TaxID=3015996 RepID=UPI0022B6FE11|nr:pectate lyase [Caulobacter sp. NIBR2454]